MKIVVIGGAGLIGSKTVANQSRERVNYQELLLFAGRVATFLRLTGRARGHIVRLKMKRILFQRILAGVIRCYQ